ncbi:hypothetical protein EJ08DRAFT_650521 [Tothia fuscella]|uniref:Xaa-Pro aminopeptidase n=1 Tax=Tothia fuscella TaxID=1048955 RepID=A0A9P4TXJ2_9PEZI|nr:hypothetical protein EJ08DRAFT_650521 [Tothia fuscella]
MPWRLQTLRPLIRVPKERAWICESRSTSTRGTRSRNYHATSPRRIAISAKELKFGQPVHETHPHLLKAGEITPGISALEYAERRWRLAELLPDGAVAIIPGANVKYRSGSVFHEFHQDPDFFYLTGFNEPEALAVIEKTTSKTPTFHLFLRPKHPKSEQWEGSRSGLQSALDVFNADESHPINQLEKTLPKILSGATKIYTDLPRSYQHNSSFSRYLSGAAPRPEYGVAKAIKDAGGEVEGLRSVMNGLRVKKNEAEIECMIIAGKASGMAFTEAMRRSWKGEKELSNFLDYQFKVNGCDGPAYVPVVAGGENALSIHYVRNDDLLDPNSMILVDAGGEYGGYITDITRTFPNNGTFSPAQEDLYECVLTVQRKCIAMCKQSSQTTLDKIHAVAEAGLRDGLKGFGFDVSGGALETLFPHHLGHYIGLDVHDSPGYARTKTLESGHCITIEPGIYVPNDDKYPKHFRGMGIRIEDSVCVREDSVLVFSTEAVKEVVDIEALRH